MPLSEEELRLLEQMERALAEEDPKFVSTLQGRTLHRMVRMRTIAAAVVFAGGVGLLFGGAMSGQEWVSVLGFVVMLASATLGLATWRGHRGGDEPAAGSAQSAHPAGSGRGFEVIDGGRRGKRPGRTTRRTGRGTFMQRMEQRWQHRRDRPF